MGNRVSVKGIVVSIDGDTTKLETALKNVNSEIKNTESKLKDVEKLLKLDPGNNTLLTQKFKTLQDDISATKDKLDTLKEASKQADDALANGSISQDQYDALQREIVETEQELKNLQQEYKNFGSVQAQEIAAAGEKVKDLGTKITNAGETLTTHLTLPLAALGTAGVLSFADVDKTMQLTNKTMGNSTEEADMLNQAMKDAASNSTYGMSDAANATLNFARAGLNAEQAAAALAPSMNLAAGEGGNLDTVSAGLVATINGFHGSFNEAGTYADVFAAACNNSALDVDSLSGAMSVAAPIFASAGYTVNDAALYMGVMANNGIEADKAANSLKTGIARLVSPAKDGAEMMAQLGISVTNADGSMKDSITIQKELHDAFGNLSESEQIAAASAIFGKNQMAPWLALINTAPEDVTSLDTSLRSCAGTTDEMAEAMMSGFGGSIEKLKSSIDVLVTSIGEALAPTVQRVADIIQELVDKFNALSPKQQEMIVQIGLVLAAVGPLLIVIGQVISAVGTIMTYAPKIVSAVSGVMGIGSKLMGGLQTLWGVLMANPIILVIAAIAGLVAGFVYFWNTSESFREFWIGLWEAIKAAVSVVVEAIVNFFTVTIPAAFSTFLEFFQGLWSGIAEFFSGIWEGLKEIVSTAWENIKNVIQLAIMAIGELFSAALTIITLPFQFIWENCKEILTVAWEGIKSVVSTALETISTTISTAWEGVVTITTTIFESVKTVFTNAWTAITTALQPILSGIQTAISTAWTAIQTTTSTIFTAIQTVATTIWSAIQSAIQPILTGIQTAVTTAWNAVQTATSTVFTAIQTLATTVWNGIQTAIQTVTTAVSTAVTTAWNAVKETTSTAFNAVKSTAETVWNGIKSTITTVIDGIKSGISTGLDAIKSAAASALDGIKSKFTDIFNGIWDTVKGIVEKLKSVFNFEWSLPHIKLPHFSVSGRFSLNPPSIPHFSVSWYKKAMENGMILNSPTIFGQSGNSLLAGGEAGPEAVVGVDSLRQMIRDAVGSVQTADTGNITIPVYIGGNLIDELIVTAEQRRALRSGGRV